MTVLPGTCELCLQKRDLVESHVIPDLAERAFRALSPSSSFRRLDSVDRPRQAVRKFHLLCSDCEQRIGIWETHFAQYFLYPYLNKNQDEFDSRDWLCYFALSLSWRTLIKEIREREANNRQVPAFWYDTAEEWRRLVAGVSGDCSGFRQHLVLAPPIPVKETLGLSSATRLGLFSSLASIVREVEGTTFTFVNLMGILFVGVIQGSTWSGWNGTLVDGSVKLKSEEQMIPVPFREWLDYFVLDLGSRMSGMSESQKQKIRERVARAVQEAIDASTPAGMAAAGGMEAGQTVGLTSVDDAVDEAPDSG